MNFNHIPVQYLTNLTLRIDKTCEYKFPQLQGQYAHCLSFCKSPFTLQPQYLEKYEGMTRGKVQLKRIQNPVSRRITFSKRKAGLLKKASELALLCDAEVALLIFSSSGNLYEFGSPNINRALEKYQKYNGSIRHHTSSLDAIEMLRVEVESLQKTMINLKTNYKHMIGEDLDSLSLKQLKNLEKKVYLGSKKLRSTKDKILQEYIGSSMKKEISLGAENATICKKICRSHKSGDIEINVIEDRSDA